MPTAKRWLEHGPITRSVQNQPAFSETATLRVLISSQVFVERHLAP